MATGFPALGIESDSDALSMVTDASREEEKSTPNIDQLVNAI